MDILTLASYAAVALVVIMLIRAVVRTLHKEKQEREGARQWAAEHGWAYTPSDPALIQQWRAYPVRGAGNAAEVLTTTIDGGRVTSFKHHRSSGFFGGGGESRHMLSVAANRSMPMTVLVPPARAMRLASLTPVPQPDEAFSARWTVLAAQPDTEAVRALLTGAFRAHVNAFELAADISSVTIDGPGLLVAFRGKRDLDSLPRIATAVRDIAADLSR